MSIWFDNIQDDSLNETIKGLICHIPSILLIPWINQLISRLGENDTNSFKENLEKLVISVCSSHPHHALYQLKSVTIMLENKATNASDEARCQAALFIWNDLKSVKGLEMILTGITKFSEKAIRVANAEAHKQI